MSKEEINSMEIMEMLLKFSDHMDERFQKIEQKFDAIDLRFERMDQRFDQVDERLDKIEQQLDYHTTWLNRIEENMVTKPQFNGLVGILRRNGVVSEFDGARVTYRV